MGIGTAAGGNYSGTGDKGSLQFPFIGIVIGGLFYGNIFQQGFSFEKSVLHIFEDGLVGVLSDPYNVGILIFLVVLGIMVSMMNKAGGSATFGQWAGRHIKTRIGAQLSAVLLGMLIFIDDYFNCLTVGSVMRPVTDKHQVSRAKLAYIIDATAKTDLYYCADFFMGGGSYGLCRRRGRVCGLYECDSI